MRGLLVFASAFAVVSPARAAAPPAWPAQIAREARSTRAAWDRLAYLCDHFGARLSGTRRLEDAIAWIAGAMRGDGLEVRLEKVRVPRWVRGAESAELTQPVAQPISMMGLGGSVGTPEDGITGEVFVVRSFDELDARKREAQDRIVLFNAPFTDYGDTVRYRWEGASRAARAGARACLVRSIALSSLRSPHTGSMGYDEKVVRIPAAAVSIEDAQMLQRMQDRGERIVLKLRMEAKTLEDTDSYNVVAEWRGRELPKEVVVLGGHIDSWDVGPGAHDDGAGVIASWEALRLISRIARRPRRTVRVVLWTNEENGGRGADAYRDAHRAELPLHVAAIESDSGAFHPRGFRFSGSKEALVQVRRLAVALAPLEADEIFEGAHGTDISRLTAEGVPGLDLDVDGGDYFRYHHSAADTPDKVRPEDLADCAAALATMSYALADDEKPLPRAQREKAK